MPIDPSLSNAPARARGRRAACVTLAVGGAALLLGACGSSKSSSSTATKTNLNTARVAHSIEASILAQRHLVATVTCPAVVPQEQGRVFECTAVIHNAKSKKTTTTPFEVTVQNSKGYVTYVGK